MRHNDCGDYVWKHAYAYARVYTSEEGAAAYAEHYQRLVASEDNATYWPGHGTTFASWRQGAGEPYPS